MGLYLGLMSGTSMDAIDAALVDFEATPIKVIASAAYPFEAGLKIRILQLLDSPHAVDLDAIGRLDVEIGRAFADAANALLSSAGIDSTRIAAIGSHGQTLRHRVTGPVPFTWQIGDPNVITETTGIVTVADFRRRDVAAGGQGAPLVPVFHDQVFRTPAENRVILNIGGIANITLLIGAEPVRGFDTGPGNRLLDAWGARHTGQDFDLNGDWAGSGRCDAQLLATLLKEPYLQLAPPKSTGRELFHLAWLDSLLVGQVNAGRTSAADVQATLLEFSCRTIAEAIRRYAPESAVYVCGGGAHNRAVMARLKQSLQPQKLDDTGALGMDPDFVEAIAFAWFAKCTLERRPINAAPVTGADGPRVLGGIYYA